MTISEAIAIAYRKLIHAGIKDSAWLDAELLLAHVLQQPRSFLTAHPLDQLNDSTIQQFNHVTIRRSRGEPLAYITGEKEFCGLSFKVTPHVLIPRPATEDLVEFVITHCRGEQRSPSRTGVACYAPTIVDIGTGSGCIAITLAKRFPHSTIIATDISAQALAIARENAARHGVADRITFLHGDLLEPILNTPHSPLSRGVEPVQEANCFASNQRDGRAYVRSTGEPREGCVLIANLPYVPTSVIESKPELAFEPKTSLDGGPDGTLSYRQLFNQLSVINDQLLPSLIVLETDDTMNQALLESRETKLLSKWYTLQRQNHILVFHLKLKRSSKEVRT